MMDSRKRRSEETEAVEVQVGRSVRQKTEQAAQLAAETNSNTSYVSAAAALFSDSDDEVETMPSEIGSESELSTSSDEPSSESDDSDTEKGDMDDVNSCSDGQTTSRTENRPTIRPGGKPNIKLGKMDDSLLKRLRQFMPQMEAANEEIEEERAAGILAERNIEITEDDEPYIEMNLGLGVLEGKPESQPGNDGIILPSTETVEDDEDVLAKLMGRHDGSRKACQIQLVEDGPHK